MSKLYTIGHSTHTLQEFTEILQAHHITHLVDVRSIPKSRHVPWFNQPKLQSFLTKHHISYEHALGLGGLRRVDKNSINQGWRNQSFRGYADFMQTPEFYAALKNLNSHLKRKVNLAIMCAEAVPWRCHRSLIADAEIVRGIKVLHILSQTSVRRHSLTAFAVVNRNKRPIQIYYPR
jgi:uncharacterized protein (DUF488 family)